MVQQPFDLLDNLAAIERFVQLVVGLVAEGHTKVGECAQRVEVGGDTYPALAQEVQQPVKVMDAGKARP